VERELWAWYRPRREAYPWRARPSPYRVLVSEVMLQQTQASRVALAFRRFLRRFPSLRSLARAPRREVIRAWAGLGYNRRAVALAEAARTIVRDHGHRVPRDPAVLRTLPGLGPYTAAAVASMAYGEPVPALDVNVRRVVARTRLGAEPAEAHPSDVETAAVEWVDRRDPGAWNQALMDLGREVCRPVPRCGTCPIAARCRFRRSGRTPSPPIRRQPPFDGSFRQVRGEVLRVLLDAGSLALRTLERRTGRSTERLHAAVLALADEGLIEVGPKALVGRPHGRVRLTR
jgi:A/G-specific adenine glycosylase